MRLSHRLLVLATFALILAAYVTLLPAPAVTRTTLDNGLRVIVIRNTLAPAVSVCLNYLAGARESPAGFPGTAHAVEHMMYRGSPGLTADQINAILGNLGGVSNAYTGHVSTQYVATVPAADLETILHLEAVRMKGISPDAWQWRLERDAINQEAAMVLSSPESRILTPLYERLFAGTPYAHDPVGTPASLAATTTGMLRQFHHDWYPPNNAILVISGDVNPSRTLALVKRLFGEIPSRPLPSRPDISLKALAATEVALPGNASPGLALLAYRLPGIGHPDYAAGQVLAAALDSPRSRVSRLRDENRLLSTMVTSVTMPQAGGLVIMATVPARETPATAAELLRKSIAAYQQEGLPADLVEPVKQRAVNAAEAVNDSIPGLAEAWSQALIDGYRTPDEDIAAIRRVTAADVTRVARSWLRTESAVTLLAPAGGSRTSAVTARAFKRAGDSFRSKTFTPVALPPWAEGARRLPAPPAPLPVTDIRLPNGLRVIVVRKGNSRTLSLYGRIRNNPFVQEPAGKEGITELLEQMLGRGETARMSRLQFRTAVDRLGASAEVGTDFSVSADDMRFEEGVSLVADALIHPAFSENEFMVIRDEYAAELAGQRHDLEWVQWLAHQQSLYPPGDPELRHQTAATIRRLTLADLREQYTAVVRPDMTTLVITGKIDPARARQIVARHFGRWRARGPAPVIDSPPVPDNRAVSTHLPDHDRQQVEVTLAQTSRLTRHHPDYYPFQLGMRILSGSSASRLYQHVREKRGLAYSIDAGFTAGRSRSVFTVTYGTDAGHVAEVRRLIEADIADMQARPVSRAELEQARNDMSRELAVIGGSSDEITTHLLMLADDGLPLDLAARSARQIRQVTPEQVQNAFSRWIRLNGLSQVTRGGT